SRPAPSVLCHLRSQLFVSTTRCPPRSPLFPSTTLFRSKRPALPAHGRHVAGARLEGAGRPADLARTHLSADPAAARRNLWVPNPEWFKPCWRDDLGDLSGTLCKTHHAEDIFAGLGCRPRFVGFTSEDRLDRAVPRQRRFLHLAGKSPVKGTEAVLEAWRRHPEWP